MIVPFIAIRAEKILKEKGTEYMKNSLALGMSREYAVIRLILPVCAVELLGTVALGMAYGMGAVAPILYTGAVMVADVPGKLTDPFMSLPYHLYMLVNNWIFSGLCIWNGVRTDVILTAHTDHM